MNMLKKLTAIGCGLFIIGCDFINPPKKPVQDKVEKKVSSTVETETGATEPEIEWISISGDSLQYEDIDENTTLYLDHQGNKLTGYFKVKEGALVTEELSLKEGLLDGFYTFYYPDGKVGSKMHFMEGTKDGESLVYFPSGKLKQQETYTKGILEKSTEYYESGQVFMKKVLEDAGLEISTFRNGKVIKEEYFVSIDNKNIRVTAIYEASGKVKVRFGYEIKDDELDDKTVYVLNDANEIIETIDAKNNPDKLMDLMM